MNSKSSLSFIKELLKLLNFFIKQINNHTFQTTINLLKPIYNKYEMNKVDKLTQQFYIDKNQVLGQGGYSIVYKGYMVSQDKIIAVKFIDRKIMQQNPQYQREIKVMSELSKIHHPNIMGYHGYQIKPQGVYCFVQLAKGGTLSQLIASKISQLKVMTLFQQILDAMTYMNKLKLVHRDLKPDNILLDQNSEVKIADFGLARNISTQMTRGACTPLYAAPQVYKKQDYQEKCDVWSAGTILYEMLTGVELFGHIQSKTELISQMNSFKNGNRHIQYPKQLHKNWSKITQKMLVYDQDKRPSFQQVLKYFRKLKDDMINDLDKKYDINIVQQGNLKKSKMNLSKLNPYIMQMILKGQDLTKKLNSQKSYAKILAAQKYLSFFRLKNDFFPKLIKLFSYSPLNNIRNIYKYLLMFLSVCIYISRISEMLVNLKKQLIKNDVQVVDMSGLVGDCKQEWNQIKNQFRENQLQNIQRLRRILNDQIIIKLTDTYMKRDQQRKIIQSKADLANYFTDAYKGTFVKNGLYMKLYNQIINLSQNMFSPKQLMKMEEIDVKTYCYIRLLGNIDDFLPDKMYKNEDFVRVRKQQIENMEKIELVNFIGKYNKK